MQKQNIVNLSLAVNSGNSSSPFLPIRKLNKRTPLSRSINLVEDGGNNLHDTSIQMLTNQSTSKVNYPNNPQYAPANYQQLSYQYSNLLVEDDETSFRAPSLPERPSINPKWLDKTRKLNRIYQFKMHLEKQYGEGVRRLSPIK